MLLSCKLCLYLLSKPSFSSSRDVDLVSSLFILASDSLLRMCFFAFRIFLSCNFGSFESRSCFTISSSSLWATWVSILALDFCLTLLLSGKAVSEAISAEGFIKLTSGFGCSKSSSYSSSSALRKDMFSSLTGRSVIWGEEAVGLECIDPSISRCFRNSSSSQIMFLPVTIPKCGFSLFTV